MEAILTLIDPSTKKCVWTSHTIDAVTMELMPATIVENEGTGSSLMLLV